MVDVVMVMCADACGVVGLAIAADPRPSQDMLALRAEIEALQKQMDSQYAQVQQQLDSVVGVDHNPRKFCGSLGAARFLQLILLTVCHCRSAAAKRIDPRSLAVDSTPSAGMGGNHIQCHPKHQHEWRNTAPSEICW